jgi:hypothetical protein
MPAGHFKLRQGVAQFVALLALDAAGDAATARIVRHQHQIAAGQADLVGQGRALVAALVLFHLDDELQAFLEHVLDAAAAEVDPSRRGNGGAGDFLERQEAVAFRAVIDEAGFQGRLDAGDDGLVDVALALFLVGGLDVEDRPASGHRQWRRGVPPPASR